MNKMLFNAEYKDIYVHGDETKYFCYRTGMTVYEEVFEKNRYMSAGWNVSGYTPNMAEDMPVRFDRSVFREAQSFDLEVDGVSLGWDWEYVDFVQQEEELETTEAKVLHAMVILKNKIKPVEVTVHTILDGSPIFTRWITVRNMSDNPMNISDAVPMCGGIEVLEGWKDYMKGAPDNSKIYSLGYMDSSAWCHEGYFKWHDFPNIAYGITGRYKGDRYRHPMFMLRNNLLGNIMFAQLGWAGGYRFDFLLDTEGTASKVSFRVALDSQKPFIVLAPKEEFDMPKVHIGMLQGDLDDAVNSMHTHLRRSVFTQPVARGKKGWVEGGMGPERLMNVEATKHFADTVAAVGAETLIIDAGWYCPLGKEHRDWWRHVGDWHYHPERYPNGIAEIRDYIHGKGLLFGLWVEPERIGYYSELRKEHPEWIAKRYDQQENTLMNMADPKVAAWAEAELTRIIEEYQIDVFRLDYNLNTPDQLCRNDNQGIPENTYIRYYQNVNALYGRLKRKFPDVIFENCAGGGGRTDVGFLSNFNHTWVSDYQVAPRSFAITNGMTMVLPPEYVDRLVSGMNCHTRASLDFQARNTIFGRPTTNHYNAVGSNMNTDQIAFVRHTMDIYKEHVRPYIDESLIYHHTPELVSGREGAGGVVEHPQGTGILERASGDGRHGVIGIFKLSDAGDKELIHVYPRGADMSLNYRITYDNTGATAVVSGIALVNEGLHIRLPGSMTSELIIYEAIV